MPSLDYYYCCDGDRRLLLDAETAFAVQLRPNDLFAEKFITLVVYGRYLSILNSASHTRFRVVYPHRFNFILKPVLSHSNYLIYFQSINHWLWDAHESMFALHFTVVSYETIKYIICCVCCKMLWAGDICLGTCDYIYSYRSL